MEIDVRQREGVTILKPRGRIIGTAGVELRQVINEHTAQASGTPKFLFDFSEVPMMDSSGLGTLVGAHVSVARAGGRIAVINVGTSINNLIVMGRLITIFERFNTEDEAIAALKA
jgi:anti-sigma B factor antagonist